MGKRWRREGMGRRKRESSQKAAQSERNVGE